MKMGEKALIVVGFIIAVLPFIIYSFISDLTKKQFIVLAVVTILIGCLASTATGRSISGWLGQSEHLLPLLLALSALLIGVLIARYATARRRRYRAVWPSRPSQREFAAACYHSLLRRGWTHRSDVSRASFSIYWMQLGRDRVTFVFAVGQLEIDPLRRLFSTNGLQPGNKVLVVLWRQPLDTMQVVLDKLGWRVFILDDFKQPEANLVEAYKAVVRPAKSALAAESWASLRGQ